MEFSYKPINPFQNDGLSKEDREMINGMRNTAYACGYRGEDVEFAVHQALKRMRRTDLLPPCEWESGETQSKQTNDSCLDFDFDKVKEILKKDGLDNLIVDHACEEKQEQTRDEKMIDAIDFAIKATDSQDDYSMGMRNGMRYVKSLIDGKEPQYESRRTDKETKLGIDLGDEVVGDYGAKGVVVGIDTYKGEVWLSLLMGKYKVPQFVEALVYKKTGRHFPQIKEVLEQIKDVVISADKAESEDKK